MESEYPKHFQIIVDEVFDDTVIDVEAGIEYKTAEVNGTEVIIKPYIESVEFEDRTEYWAYIDIITLFATAITFSLSKL